MKDRKIQIVEWPDAPKVVHWVHGVTCDHCHADLLLPSAPGTRILAAIGMGLVFDNTVQPANAIPDVMRCPVCRHTYERQGALK